MAVVGAALQRGRLAAAGTFVVFATAASPYLGLGTAAAFSGTPSFYHGWGVDIGVASLLPTLLLVAAGLAAARGDRAPRRPLPAGGGLRPGPYRGGLPVPWTVAGTDLMGTLMSPGGPPELSVGPAYPMPWLTESKPFLRILGLALAVAIFLAWRYARTRPAWALACGLVLRASPIRWCGSLLRTDPVPTP